MAFNRFHRHRCHGGGYYGYGGYPYGYGSYYDDYLDYPFIGSRPYSYGYPYYPYW